MNTPNSFSTPKGKHEKTQTVQGAFSGGRKKTQKSFSSSFFATLLASYVKAESRY